MKKVECIECRFYQGRDRAEEFFPGSSNIEGCEIVIDCVRSPSGFGNSCMKNVDKDCSDFKKKRFWHK